QVDRREWQDPQAGHPRGGQHEPEGPPVAGQIRDDPAQVVPDGDSGQDDTDDAGPGVERDPEVRSEQTSGGDLENERRGARDEDDRVGRPGPAADHAVLTLRASAASTMRASRTIASTTSAAPGRSRTSPTPCPASRGK